VRYPEDYSSVTYRINPNARWHDGEPVTARTWSGRSRSSRTQPEPGVLLPARHQGRGDRRARGDLHLRRDRQSRAAAYRRPVDRAAEALVGGHRRQRQAARHRPETLEPPLGSGPYRSAGHAGPLDLLRARADYWGADLNTSTSARTTSTRSATSTSATSTVEFEAFKADQFDFWTENEARRWATGYDFPPSGRAASRS
jgi:microcin C transport system substrate-binding protein